MAPVGGGRNVDALELLGSVTTVVEEKFEGKEVKSVNNDVDCNVIFDDNPKLSVRI